MSNNEFDSHEPVLSTDNSVVAAKKMRLALSTCASGWSEWWQAMGLAEDTRYCWWAGKGEDGRKNIAEELGLDDPWLGCSDAEVRFAEMVSNEKIETHLRAVMRSPLEMVSPVESGDMRLAEKGKALLRWVTGKMPELSKERRLFATWRADYGPAVMWVDWRRTETIVDREVQLADVLELVGLGPYVEYALGKGEGVLTAWMQGQGTVATAVDVEAQQALAEAGRMMAPGNEAEGVDYLKSYFPEMDAKGLRDLITSLRETGAGTVEVQAIGENRPVWSALLPGDNVFFPANTRLLNEAPWIAVREFIDAGELRARTARVHGEMAWDAKWVEAVIAAGSNQTGSFLGSEVLARRSKVRSVGGSIANELMDSQQAARLFEVWTAFCWQTDKRGRRTLRRLVFSSTVAEENCWGLDIVTQGCGGEMPFVLGVYRWEAKQILKCAGVPALVRGGQLNLKVLRDGRINLTDIALRPPMIASLRDRGRSEQSDWRPGGRTYESIRGTSTQATINMQGFQPATEMSREIYGEQLRLAGAAGELTPPEVLANHNEVGVMDFMEDYSRILKMTWQLMQANMGEETVMRVTGALGQPFTMGAEDIAGQWDLNFSVRPELLGMAPEFLKVRDEIIQSIVATDTQGILDKAKVMRDRLDSVDPFAADRWVTNPQEQTEKEVNDELNNLSLMLNGIEPPMNGKGQNVQLREQVLTQALQRMPGAAKRAQDPDVQALIENRLKHFKWVQTQYGENAQIGREAGVKMQMPR